MNTLGNLYATSLAFLPSIGIPEVVVILFFLLLLFGGKKLPELARGMGRGLRHFKEEIHGIKSKIDETVDLDTPPEAPAPKAEAPSPSEANTDETKTEEDNKD